ncbi:hypothetical protein [Mesorhizobium sp. Arg314]
MASPDRLKFLPLPLNHGIPLCDPQDRYLDVPGERADEAARLGHLGAAPLEKVKKARSAGTIRPSLTHV